MGKETWEFYIDPKGKHRWTRKAGNGLTIGASTQGYVNKSACVANAILHGYKG